MWIFLFDKVQLFALFGFYHFSLEEMIIFELSVGRMMGVDEHCFLIEVISITVFSMLETSDSIMILKDIIEVGIFFNENIDCFIANKFHLFVCLSLYFVPTHDQYIRILFLSWTHPPVKVSTQSHAL